MHIEVLTDFNDCCGSSVYWTVSSRNSSLLLILVAKAVFVLAIQRIHIQNKRRF